MDFFGRARGFLEWLSRAWKRVLFLNVEVDLRKEVFSGLPGVQVLRSVALSQTLWVGLGLVCDGRSLCFPLSTALGSGLRIPCFTKFLACRFASFFGPAT